MVDSQGRSARPASCTFIELVPSDAMTTTTRLRVGCRFEHDASEAVAAVVLVEPHSDVAGEVLEERWDSQPDLAMSPYLDAYGNRFRRLVLPEGESALSYDAIVAISGDPDVMPGPAEAQHRIENLADGALHWLLPSRYCESDLFGDRAWELFGETGAGAERVQAVCDWIHGNVEYGVVSLPTTTTAEVFKQRGGVCRDFAHLGVTLCRALGIPARYVSGYLPDIGVPLPHTPMDFHAWFEVWLGTQWWAFDARHNTPRVGRVPIGRGRDAADVAMITTYGDATLRAMTVWSDEVAAADGR
jgi:transglutaminase-like putative cysteine protease